MKRPTNESVRIIHAGVAEALAEIHRQAEARLREIMKPAQLRPLNLSHVNGRAASKAILVEELRS